LGDNPIELNILIAECQLCVASPPFRDFVLQFQARIAEDDFVVDMAVPSVGSGQSEESVSLLQRNGDLESAVDAADLPAPESRLPVDQHPQIGMNRRVASRLDLRVAGRGAEVDESAVRICSPESVKIEANRTVGILASQCLHCYVCVDI
jgi:hypothetical protein